MTMRYNNKANSGETNPQSEETRPPTGTERLLFYLSALLWGLLLALSCWYVILLLERGLDTYNRVKTPILPNHANTSTQLDQRDPILGNRLIPNASGFFLIKDGVPVPFHHDATGLRSPPKSNAPQSGVRHQLLAFFGDSFTYGQLVPVEETFAYRSATQLGGESINAGVPGYSLAQMLLYAERLLKTHKVDYLVVQYSPWLVARAEAGKLSENNLFMAPYFSSTANGMRVEPAPFTPSESLWLRTYKYKHTPKSVPDAISFLATVGLPLWLGHAYHATLFHAKQLLGLAPRKSTDTLAIIKYAYQAFDELAKENHAKLVILALGTAVPLHVPTDLFPKDAIVVNGWKAMVDELNPPTTNNYIRQYFQWRGNPPIPVDWHPNEKADAIVANAIAQAIRHDQKVSACKSQPVSASACEAGSHAKQVPVTVSSPKQVPAECALIPSKKSLIPAQPRMLDAVTLSVFREKWLTQGLCRGEWGGI